MVAIVRILAAISAHFWDGDLMTGISSTSRVTCDKGINAGGRSPIVIQLIYGAAITGPCFLITGLPPVA